MYQIVIPTSSLTVTEGKIVRWAKVPGDRVEAGEVVAEVETEKATIEVRSRVAGWLGPHLHEEGSVLPVSTTIVHVLDAHEADMLLQRHRAADQSGEADSGGPVAASAVAAQLESNESSALSARKAARVRWQSTTGDALSASRPIEGAQPAESDEAEVPEPAVVPVDAVASDLEVGQTSEPDVDRVNESLPEKIAIAAVPQDAGLLGRGVEAAPPIQLATVWEAHDGEWESVVIKEGAAVVPDDRDEEQPAAAESESVPFPHERWLRTLRRLQGGGTESEKNGILWTAISSALEKSDTIVTAQDIEVAATALDLPPGSDASGDRKGEGARDFFGLAPGSSVAGIALGLGLGLKRLGRGVLVALVDGGESSFASLWQTLQYARQWRVPLLLLYVYRSADSGRSISVLAGRWAALGFASARADGHDVVDIFCAIARARAVVDEEEGPYLLEIRSSSRQSLADIVTELEARLEIARYPPRAGVRPSEDRYAAAGNRGGVEST